MTDLKELRKNTDLLKLIGGKFRLVSSSEGGELAGQCPLCGLGHDRFRIQPNHIDGPRWFNRGGGGRRPACTCGSNDGKWHDALDYVQFRDGVTFQAALATLSGNHADPAAVYPKPAEPEKPDLPPNPGPPDHHWQKTAMRLIADSIPQLWDRKTPEARAAFYYLTDERGLSHETIFKANLGFNQEARKVAGRYWLEAGITIPILIDDNLWAIKVRTSKEDQARGRPKYAVMAGSKTNCLFGTNDILWADYAIATEGELDALLIKQHLPTTLWAACTMGSAANVPGTVWQVRLSHLTKLHLAFDNDQAGKRAFRSWKKEIPWVELATVPFGKDITEYWQMGGDLDAWISELMQ